MKALSKVAASLLTYQRLSGARWPERAWGVSAHVASRVRPAKRRWLMLAGLSLTLAGCGSSQNWSQDAAYVTIGGTVSGLTGGKLVLTNNGSDPLTVTASGAFTFALKVAPYSAYTVAVQTQPDGAICSVTAGGTGTAATNITTVQVTCLPDVTVGGTVSGLNGGVVVLQNNKADDLAVGSDGTFTFAQKIHEGGAYSVTVKTPPNGELCAVTNASGSASGNVTSVRVLCSPFVRRLLPDLGLLHSAGFNLLRLFGSDAVAQKIISLAQANYPEMRFQLGIYLRGASASCVDSVNQSQMDKAIELANAYSNVITVSVGNETSFAANLPDTCLASYLQYVRAQVAQPITADDDYTFYAGLTSSGEKPNLVLPLLDFASIHMYPLSNSGRWDWHQLSVATGPDRAAAMMAASLQNAVDSYNAVANYLFRDNSGSTVTIASAMPIVVGETGWKATQTNGNSLIELYTANPINQKWYFDLLNGWQAGGSGPVSIFYFEGFDEAWKGLDDGWGLWDAARTARYALCGTAVGSACNTPVYDGAGYYP